MQKSTNRFCNGKAMQLLLSFLVTGSPVALLAQSYQSLSEKVSVNLENTTADVVVKSLEKQTPYTFTYDPEYLQHCAFSTVKFNNQPLGDVLHFLDVYAPLDIAFVNKTVALKQGKQERVAGQDKGRVTGKIVDNKNEPLPGVTIQSSDGQGIVTSVDGTYTLSLQPGTYTLTFSYISYDTRKVTDVIVKEKSILPLDIVMKSAGSHLKEVTITGNYKRASVEGLYALQKNNASITDGISAEQISRTPDKNIGDVLKRVSGLATVDNKYVVVRGLSERYNQAVLNGQVMPSTEMNRKNFSFDIIPSNIVENVTVVKTLTPDRSAEFGGGSVEVNTLDMPAQDFLNIGIGGSTNDKTTGKNFRTLKLEGQEYWGKAASHRNLLGKLDWTNTADVIAKYNAENKQSVSFSNNWGVYEMKAPVSQNYQLSAGKVFHPTSKDQFGVVVSASYRNTFQTKDVRMSRDGFDGAGDGDEAGRAAFSGKSYGFSTSLGGLLGLGYKNERTRLSFQSLFLRSLDQQLLIGSGYHSDPSGFLLGYYDLTTQTNLWQNQLKGEHALGKRGIRLKWMGSYVLLDKQRPDNHQLKATMLDNDKLESNEFNIRSPFSSGISEGALRWWSRTYEKDYNWDLAISAPFNLGTGKLKSENTLKVGYAGWSKNRLFYVLNSGSKGYNTADFPPLAQTFVPERGGEIYFNRFTDDFHKTAVLHGVYAMLDNKINDRWRLVWGVRAEGYNLNKINNVLDSLFRQINESRGPGTQLDYSALTNREPNWRFFPSANLTYTLTQQMNLRLAYAESIIRPDLRELSFFNEYDFELGGTYGSNLVKSTTVQHFDFRYEWYPAAGEVLSATLFYKKFRDPMEIYKQGDNRIYFLKNNKYAKNYGLEVEVRKSLSFTQVPVIRNITLYGNFTALSSRVTPVDIDYGSLDPNDPNKVLPVEKVGKEEKRPQTGASNYMVNAGFYYDIKPVSFSLVYNYVTNRMFRPAAYYSESLFERPLESLDGQLAIRLLKQKMQLRLNISNLLNSYSVVYRNFYKDAAISNHQKDPSIKDLLYQKGQDLIDYESRPGRTFSITIGYSF
ncbi:Outer membrane receptor proteins, mostly Fe transport [Chitinophaga sp. YR573]|uniref:TonB-dependent receptor domain-containing protein n=1 Tax=Chitinophaga sp. YR573 TaxID=1881040 RepID=UPI0008C3F93A|nr:TonB-dependent receptor [Chitinophaga sp. YR573]SEW20191.1 Outer membrane receptor proteins, mostly Fe transport [Chitinophaga sp. YR573]